MASFPAHLPRRLRASTQHGHLMGTNPMIASQAGRAPFFLIRITEGRIRLSPMRAKPEPSRAVLSMSSSTGFARSEAAWECDGSGSYFLRLRKGAFAWREIQTWKHRCGDLRLHGASHADRMDYRRRLICLKPIEAEPFINPDRNKPTHQKQSDDEIAECAKVAVQPAHEIPESSLRLEPPLQQT